MIAATIWAIRRVWRGPTSLNSADGGHDGGRGSRGAHGGEDRKDAEPARSAEDDEHVDEGQRQRASPSG